MELSTDCKLLGSSTLFACVMSVHISGEEGEEVMVRGVGSQTPAVSSTTLHGSVRTSLRLPLMILSCGFAVIMFSAMKMP